MKHRGTVKGEIRLQHLLECEFGSTQSEGGSKGVTPLGLIVLIRRHSGGVRGRGLELVPELILNFSVNTVDLCSYK